jgi:hypothetical protein
MAYKENDILARTIADLREKLVVLERAQEMRKMDKKTYDNMQRYQEQVYGLLSGKSSTKLSNNSWMQKHGPLVMNYTYDDNGTKRSSSYNRMSERENQQEH